jgi:glyoxylase-like metal-dependent hydrolase (beta-lactamase superfamily II)
MDSGDGIVCFDTGINGLLTRMGFKQLGLDPCRVSHVFLTHSDYDHMGGVKEFRNAQVYLSKQEEPMVTGGKTRLLYIKRNARLSGYTFLRFHFQLPMRIA